VQKSHSPPTPVIQILNRVQDRHGAPGAADPEPSEARAEGHACGTHEVIHSPFEGELTPLTYPSIGAWIPDRRSAPSGMTV
ncbi:MAG: hypothetical protein R6U20_12610, partial [Longimonas sp.]